MVMVNVMSIVSALLFRLRFALYFVSVMVTVMPLAGSMPAASTWAFLRYRVICSGFSPVSKR